MQVVASPWLTITDSAKYLHMDENRMCALVRSGEIQSRRHGIRGAYIHANWLDEWMMAQPSASLPLTQSLQRS